MHQRYHAPRGPIAPQPYVGGSKVSHPGAGFYRSSCLSASTWCLARSNLSANAAAHSARRAMGSRTVGLSIFSRTGRRPSPLLRDKSLLQEARWISHLRNAVCHMSPIPDEELQRVRQVMRDWYRIIPP
jgi:hypothetical protein